MFNNQLYLVLRRGRSEAAKTEKPATSAPQHPLREILFFQLIPVLRRPSCMRYHNRSANNIGF